MMWLTCYKVHCGWRVENPCPWARSTAGRPVGRQWQYSGEQVVTKVMRHDLFYICFESGAKRISWKFGVCCRRGGTRGWAQMFSLNDWKDEIASCWDEKRKTQGKIRRCLVSVGLSDKQLDLVYWVESEIEDTWEASTRRWQTWDPVNLLT